MVATRVKAGVAAFGILGAGALTVLAAPATAATTSPTYLEYDMGFKGGEPVIGYDPGRNETYYAAGTKTLKLIWNPVGAITKTDISPSFSPTTLDTILVTDQRTHRTFVSYLALACSIMSFTNDGGETWSQSSGCGAGAAVDHQTVGVGPLHAPLTPVAGYDGAVYYCAQDAFNGQCAVSLDGGVTFGPAVPVANTPANLVGDPFGGACSALHGHERSGPDGTAYLPLKGCGGVPTANNLTNSEFFGGRPSLSVSENNGVSWTVRMGPAGTHNPDESDPSVAIGPQGTMYFGWQDGTNPTDAVGGTETAAKIATSKDGGKTWGPVTDVSTPLGIHNVQFPEVIVGDDTRAAFAWIGTPGVGNDQDDAFRGDWHMYVSTTYDSGAHWTTVDATPTNLINRGCVHMLGLAPGTQRTDNCSFRNMLDFNDITVDKDGRVLVAYTDACGDDCSASDGENADTKELMTLRQTCGQGLYAAGDATIATTCAATKAAGPPAGSTGATGGARSGRSGGSSALPATGLPGALSVLAAAFGLGALLLHKARRAA